MWQERRDMNTSVITNNSELAEFLHKLGFRTRQFKSINKIIPQVPRKFTEEYLCWLVAQDNDLDSHSLISIEENSLVVYYYDEGNDLYRVWEIFSGEIELSIFRDSILAAMTNEGLRSRFGNT